MDQNSPSASHLTSEVCRVAWFRSVSHAHILSDASGGAFLGMRMNSSSSSALPRLCSRTSYLKTQSRFVIPPPSTKEIFHRKSGEDFSKNEISALLRGRLCRCFFGASRRFSAATRRISGGIWTFRCSGTRHFSRRRRRGRGSWTCRRSDRFSFLLARRKKRGSGQNADVFLHSSKRTLL
jgi:hypothetical protein